MPIMPERHEPIRESIDILRAPHPARYAMMELQHNALWRRSEIPPELMPLLSPAVDAIRTYPHVAFEDKVDIGGNMEVRMNLKSMLKQFLTTVDIGLGQDPALINRLSLDSRMYGMNILKEHNTSLAELGKMDTCVLRVNPTNRTYLGSDGLTVLIQMAIAEQLAQITQELGLPILPYSESLGKYGFVG